VVTALCRTLDDEDADVRVESARALDEAVRTALTTGTHQAEALAGISALFRSLKTEPRADVRLASARALQSACRTVLENQSVPSKRLNAPFDYGLRCVALVQALKDKDAGVRQAAAETLAFMGPQASDAPPAALLAALDDEAPEVRRAAALALGSLKGPFPYCKRFAKDLDPAIPLLLRGIERETRSTRDAFEESLEFIQPSAAVVPQLADALKSPHYVVRRAAARSLGRIGPAARAAVPTLISNLNDGHIPVSDQGSVGRYARRTPGEEAARALGKIAPGTDAADAEIAALIALLSSWEPTLRSVAAESLAAFGSIADAALPDHIKEKIVDSTLDYQRDWAAARRANPGSMTAPGAWMNEAPLVPLLQALTSSNSRIRKAAARALGRIGPRASAAIPALEALANDTDLEVASAARDALGEINKPSSKPSSSGRDRRIR
jgi:HEAT repeat protein